MSPAPSLDRRPARRAKKSRMSYITPPSSIKTAESVDSSVDGPSTEDEHASDQDKASTRFLSVGAVLDKKDFEASLLKALATSGCTLRTVDVHVVQNDGELVIAFHDLRAARRASRTLAEPKDGPLLALLQTQAPIRYLTPEEASKKLCDPAIVADMDGGFYLSSTLDQYPLGTGDINVRALKNYLQSFGALQQFAFVREEVENKAPVKTFRVEFYDARDAASAYQTVHKQTVFGMTMSVYGRSAPPRSGNPWMLRPTENEAKETKPTDTPTTIYSSRDHRFSVASQFTGTGTATSVNPAATHAHAHPPPQWEGEIRAEQRMPVCANPDRNCDYCPSRKTPHAHAPYNFPPTPSPPIVMCSPPPPHMMMSPPPMAVQAVPIDYSYAPQLYGYPPWTFDKTMSMQSPLANVPPTMQMSSPAIPYAPPPIPFWPGAEDPARMRGIPPPFPSTVPVECAFPNGMPMAPFQLPPTPPSTVARHSTPAHPTPSPPVESFGRLSLHNGGIQVYPAVADVASKNQLVISKIESGQDTRTTVMIKNIPNKMSDKELIVYINKVCPRRIDFLYLRMDFQNGCNVGYAFVNFIETQDLLKFAKSRLGEKWNMFSSEKVLQMSYANYQGKEALVEKFKNSCIMDEREAWRPKIFFSFGPNQGLPEPFPAPTHMRRKERSSFNRGALYVPGLHTRNNNLHGGGDDHRPSLGARGGRRGGQRAGASA